MADISKVVVSIGQMPIDIGPLVSAFPGIDFSVVEPDAVNEALVDADAALVGFVNTREGLPNAGRLKFLQTAAAGVEHIDAAALAERGILFANGSGIMASNMAEHVIGLMLAFARGLPRLLKAQEAHAWRSGVTFDSVFELRGQQVVLVGLGDIGLNLAQRLQAFGMSISGVRRTPNGPVPATVDRVVTIDQLDDVLATADHVICSLPLTAETRGLFDADRFAAFKPGAYFYNVGRGGSVVQPDLVAALESGQLGGAGLDVTTPEPLTEDDPLWGLPNVIITGHTAGATPLFTKRAVELFARNLRRLLNGEPLENLVDATRGY